MYKSIADFERQTRVQFPEDIAAMLTAQAEHINPEKETRLALALESYKNGEVTMGLGARLAGVPYSEFLLHMAEHKLSPYTELDEQLASEFANAVRASDRQ